jgi:PIN domain nuclease of toxin-antitoxin system
MPGVVADTHTIVWYLSKDSRLSLAAHAALTVATTGGDLIHISSICLVEMTYLSEKGRLPSGAREALVEHWTIPQVRVRSFRSTGWWQRRCSSSSEPKCRICPTGSSPPPRWHSEFR